MNPSKRILIAACLASVMTATAGFTAAPFASATEASRDPIASRIEQAFAVAADAQTHPDVASVTMQARKGDLPGGLGCGAQKWPEIAANCLVTSDGTPVRPVRFATVSYRMGESASMLMRMPAPQVAAR